MYSFDLQYQLDAIIDSETSVDLLSSVESLSDNSYNTDLLYSSDEGTSSISLQADLLNGIEFDTYDRQVLVDALSVYMETDTEINENLYTNYYTNILSSYEALEYTSRYSHLQYTYSCGLDEYIFSIPYKLRYEPKPVSYSFDLRSKVDCGLSSNNITSLIFNYQLSEISLQYITSLRSRVDRYLPVIVETNLDYNLSKILLDSTHTYDLDYSLSKVFKSRILSHSFDGNTASIDVDVTNYNVVDTEFTLYIRGDSIYSTYFTVPLVWNVPYTDTSINATWDNNVLHLTIPKIENYISIEMFDANNDAVLGAKGTFVKDPNASLISLESSVISCRVAQPTTCCFSKKPLDTNRTCRVKPEHSTLYMPVDAVTNEDYEDPINADIIDILTNK